MKDLYEFQEFYPCSCDYHFLRVTKFKDEPEIYMDKLESTNVGSGLFDRISLALQYIINPKKYDLYGNLVFSKSTAKQLSRDLLKITQEKNPNLITGKKG